MHSFFCTKMGTNKTVPAIDWRITNSSAVISLLISKFLMWWTFATPFPSSLLCRDSCSFSVTCTQKIPRRETESQHPQCHWKKQGATPEAQDECWTAVEGQVSFLCVFWNSPGGSSTTLLLPTSWVTLFWNLCHLHFEAYVLLDMDSRSSIPHLISMFASNFPRC